MIKSLILSLALIAGISAPKNQQEIQPDCVDRCGLIIQFIDSDGIDKTDDVIGLPTFTFDYALTTNIKGECKIGGNFDCIPAIACHHEGTLNMSLDGNVNNFNDPSKPLGQGVVVPAEVSSEFEVQGCGDITEGIITDPYYINQSNQVIISTSFPTSPTTYESYILSILCTYCGDED